MAPVTAASSMPTTVNDYTIVPLAFAPTASFPKKTTHYLYLRQHNPKVPTATSDREIFLVNIPIDTTTTHLRYLFSTHLSGARVENVTFESINTKATTPSTPAISKKRKRSHSTATAPVDLPQPWDRELQPSGASATVTLVDASTLDLALRAATKIAKSHKSVPWATDALEAKLPSLGSKRYTTHHALTYPAADALQTNVDAFMTAFAAKEGERSRVLARQRQEPDDDGFVTVVRGGRAGPARQEEAEERLVKQNERQKGKEDFYRFQMREKNKERANELLRGFEEDRRRVEEMRGRRNKFRPH